MHAAPGPRVCGAPLRAAPRPGNDERMEKPMPPQQTSAPARLRALLKQDAMVIAPGAYDCISARVIAQAGFPAVYMTGARTAAMLGYPDFGLVTMSEMADNAGRLAAVVSLPVIADADTG